MYIMVHDFRERPFIIIFHSSWSILGKKVKNRYHKYTCPVD